MSARSSVIHCGIGLTSATEELLGPVEIRHER